MKYRMKLNLQTPAQKLRAFYVVVMLSYLPPFLWQLLASQTVYQHGYHILLVLLASGVATGVGVRSPRLLLFLFASMALNVALLLLDALGLRFGPHVSLGALMLLVLSIAIYYASWATALYQRWRNGPPK